MVTEKNNMHDVDTSMFFKWVFKAYVAVYLVTHTFDITMAVFDMAQHVVSGAAGVIGGSTNIDVAAALASMQSGLCLLYTSNHGITLQEAKFNFSKFGACEKEMLCYVRSPRDDEKEIS